MPGKSQVCLNLNEPLVYEELLRDNEKFQKYIVSVSQSEVLKKRRRFMIPEGLENIFSEPYSAPNEELVRNEIKGLWKEYEVGK